MNIHQVFTAHVTFGDLKIALKPKPIFLFILKSNRKDYSLLVRQTTVLTTTMIFP